jgi:5-methylcytosine-specific restriction enzyme subunit McrC
LNLNTITLFEHDYSPFLWTDKDLSDLDRVNKLLGAELLSFTIKGKDRYIKSNEYVGIIRFGNYSIQVLPKMYKNAPGISQKEIERQATGNLLHMLSIAGQLPFKDNDLTNLLEKKLDWFEIITRLFVKNMIKEWQRGVYRTYQTREEELSILRGKWKVYELIKKPERKHRFSVQYDEFETDNLMNRIFRFVVERLWNLTRDPANRNQLATLRSLMQEVVLLPSVAAHECNRITISRLNQQYEPLLHIAQLFLSNQSFQLTNGSERSFAFVFDMNALYENYIINLIRRFRSDILPSYLNESDLLPQSQGCSLFLASHLGKKVFRLKPDLTFRINSTTPLILDTKYKRLSTKDRQLGVSQADFYQMAAYAHRYECAKIILLYPQTADIPQPIFSQFHIENSITEIIISTVDLRLNLNHPAGRKQLIQSLRQLLEVRSE